MEYRSQLVVRTRDAEGARVIARVKEIADERGTSISDAALELLAQAIDGVPAAPAAAKEDEKEEKSSTSSGKAKSSSSKTKDEDSEEREALPTSPNLNSAPHEVVLKAVEYLQSKGQPAAVKCLAQFYEKASAVDGGRVRAELTHRLEPDEYEELHAVLRETDEYRAYTERLVRG